MSLKMDIMTAAHVNRVFINHYFLFCNPLHYNYFAEIVIILHSYNILKNVMILLYITHYFFSANDKISKLAEMSKFLNF